MYGNGLLKAYTLHRWKITWRLEHWGRVRNYGRDGPLILLLPFIFSAPVTDASSPIINVTLEKFKGNQDSLMPSPEELQRVIAVMSGLAEPETEEEKGFAPSKNETNQEKFMNNKLLDARFIAGASDIQACVGRIRTSDDGYGTGFRISENLVMTAAHVFTNSREGVIHFHYYEPPLLGCPGSKIPQIAQPFSLEPEDFFYANDCLDFAVIAISGTADELKGVGIISALEIGKCLTNEHTNIFSHPEGQPMKVSLRQNVAVEQPRKKLMVGLDKQWISKDNMSARPNVVIHESDTEGGSSGAPIFNDKWQLVAIHQGYTEEKHGKSVCVGNYGCLMKYIVEDMYSKRGEDFTEFEKKLKDHAQDVGIPFAKHAKNFRK